MVRTSSCGRTPCVQTSNLDGVKRWRHVPQHACIQHSWPPRAPIVQNAADVEVHAVPVIDRRQQHKPWQLLRHARRRRRILPMTNAASLIIKHTVLTASVKVGGSSARAVDSAWCQLRCAASATAWG